MNTYIASSNFIEHDMNSDKYLLKIDDGMMKYPKLYIFNNTSYVMYKYVLENPNSTIDMMLQHIMDIYPKNRDDIKIEDIEKCVNDFVEAGIFEETKL